MAQIYESGKVRTDIPQPTFRASQLANRGLNEQLEKEKQDAFNMYEQGLSIQASESMNTIFQEYGNDPTELSQKLSELNEKMSAEIPDAKMKVNFKTKFIMNSQSLVNKAQANYDKAQFEKKRSSYFNTIYDNNRRISLAFENAFTGNATVDDMVNYQAAINQNKALINTLNEDGTFMFSDAQRLAMSRDVDELATKSFEASLLSMDDDKRAQLLSSLDADEAIIFSAEDEDKNTIQLNLKDAVGKDTYIDMKRIARDTDAKIKNQQLKEFNLNKRYAEMQYILNPTNENYKMWEFYNPDVSEEKKKRMQNRLTEVNPGYDVITTYDDYSEAFSDIKDRLDTIIDDDEVKNSEIFNTASDIVAKIRRSPVTRGEDGTKYGINREDRDKLESIIAKKISDPLFRDLVADLPNVDAFKSLRYKIGVREDINRQIADIEREPLPEGFGFDVIRERKEALRLRDERIAGLKNKLRELDRFSFKNSKIDQKGVNTLSYITGLVAGAKNLQDPEVMRKVKKNVKDVWEKQMLSAYAIKYDHIPDLRQDLIKGETVVNINGLPYKYMGFSNDKPQFELLTKGK